MKDLILLMPLATLAVGVLIGYLLVKILLRVTGSQAVALVGRLVIFGGSLVCADMSVTQWKLMDSARDLRGIVPFATSILAASLGIGLLIAAVLPVRINSETQKEA